MMRTPAEEFYRGTTGLCREKLLEFYLGRRRLTLVSLARPAQDYARNPKAIWREMAQPIIRTLAKLLAQHRLLASFFALIGRAVETSFERCCGQQRVSEAIEIPVR